MTHQQTGGVVTDSGFDQLSRGTLGNAGHDLYVSRAGILQRIAYFDVNGDGYVDLPFANTHDDAVRVPAFFYPDPLHDGEPLHLASEGIYAMAVGDLTGDGYDDVVLANQYNGSSNEVHANVYYGGPDGFSTKRMIRLWAPSSKDVAIGRVSSTDRPSLLFASREQLRIFEQTQFGFQPEGYRDVPLAAPIETLVAADLDQDGFDDLVVRSPDSSIRIYWGGPDGIRAERHLLLDPGVTGNAPVGPGVDLASIGAASAAPTYDTSGPERAWRLFVSKVPESPRIKVVALRGIPRLFLCPGDEALFCTFTGDRQLHRVDRIATGPVMSVAIGPVSRPGAEDLVFASRQRDPAGQERSSVWWDGGVGDVPTRYSPESRTEFCTVSANDAALADLDGSGRAAVVICQDKTVTHYTTSSQVLQFSDTSSAPDITVLPTWCALDASPVRRPGMPDGLVFANHRAETAQGHLDSPIYLGGPDGYHADRRIDLRGWGACEMKFIDLFDRGRPDVLMMNSNENDPTVPHPSYIFLGGVDGPRASDPIPLATDRALSAVVADFDRDGYLDIITGSWGWNQPGLRLFRGGPNGFGEPEIIPMTVDGREYLQPRFMAVGDLDRTGWLDMVVPTFLGDGGALIFRGGPEGFSPDRAYLLPCGRVLCANIADLDGDGWMDLVVGQMNGADPLDEYSGSVFIYWGGPDGFSNERRTELPASYPTDVTIADFNGGGALDLFVSNYYGWRTRDVDSYLYWGAPGGRFDPERVTRLPHHSAHGGLAADFNEDGYLDLAVANHRENGNHPSRSYVWWNGPDGFSPDRRTELPTRGPHGITHTDLGNQADRGPEEMFISRPIKVPVGSAVQDISWSGTVPPKTWVRGQWRQAPAPDGLVDAEWTGPRGPGSWAGEDGPSKGGDGSTAGGMSSGTVESAPEHADATPSDASWAQYRLALGATNAVATPRIEAVHLIYALPATPASPAGKSSATPDGSEFNHKALVTDGGQQA